MWNQKKLENTPDSWYIRNGIEDKGAMTGEWLTWILDPSTEFEVEPPPIRNSIEDQYEIAKVKLATESRQPLDLNKIYFWQGSSGLIKGAAGDNITPAGVWQNILFQEVGSTQTNLSYAKSQKLLAESIVDSFILCWRVKYKFLYQRPSMRIASLNAALADPPFPSYVSEYSTISETANVVLTHIYPQKSMIWNFNSEDAGNSRLIAGIHFEIDKLEGEALGKAVGEEILNKEFPDQRLPLPSKKIQFSEQNQILTLIKLNMIKIKLNILNELFSKTIIDSFYKIKSNLSGSFKDVIDTTSIPKLEDAMGVTWYDYNHDGLLDLLILGFSDGNKLYRNTQYGTFIDVTKESKIDTKPAVAGIFGDYNNDGCPDLYLTISGWTGGVDTPGEADILEKNNCDGTFTNISDKAGIRDSYHGFGAAWADYNNDGLLDLYVANYGIHEGRVRKYEPNIMYRNNGDDTFTDVTLQSGLTGESKCFDDFFNFSSDAQRKKQSYQPVWFDFNNDNKIDLYLANDRGENVLYKNNGDSTFTDVTKNSGLCLRGTGMGVAVGDYNNDGFEDLYVTNIGVNYLWHNNGNETFSEVSEKARTDQYAVGWGTNFLDYDNDGFLDLFVTNGTVPETPNKFSFEDKLYHNLGDGTFEEVSQKEGIYSEKTKLASAIGDYNNDGFVDIFEVMSKKYSEGASSSNHSSHLFKNMANHNNWLTIELVGTKSNRGGVGAKIRLTTDKSVQVREVINGSSFISQNSPWQTFGLGKSNIVKSIEVIWPSGITKTLSNIKVNQKITIYEERIYK